MAFSISLSSVDPLTNYKTPATNHSLSEIDTFEEIKEKINYKESAIATCSKQIRRLEKEAKSLTDAKLEKNIKKQAELKLNFRPQMQRDQHTLQRTLHSLSKKRIDLESTKKILSLNITVEGGSPITLTIDEEATIGDLKSLISEKIKPHASPLSNSLIWIDKTPIYKEDVKIKLFFSTKEIFFQRQITGEQMEVKKSLDRITTTDQALGAYSYTFGEWLDKENKNGGCPLRWSSIEEYNKEMDRKGQPRVAIFGRGYKALRNCRMSMTSAMKTRYPRHPGRVNMTLFFLEDYGTCNSKGYPSDIKLTKEGEEALTVDIDPSVYPDYCHSITDTTISNNLNEFDTLYLERLAGGSVLTTPATYNNCFLMLKPGGKVIVYANHVKPEIVEYLLRNAGFAIEKSSSLNHLIEKSTAKQHKSMEVVGVKPLLPEDQ